MPRPKGSKNKVKTTKVTADFAAQIAAKQEEKAAVEEGRSRGCAEKAPRQRCERRRNS